MPEIVCIAHAIAEPAHVLGEILVVHLARDARVDDALRCDSNRLDELERTDGTTALIAMCTGGGMGTATIIERI